MFQGQISERFQNLIHIHESHELLNIKTKTHILFFARLSYLEIFNRMLQDSVLSKIIFVLKCDLQFFSFIEK